MLRLSRERDNDPLRFRALGAVGPGRSNGAERPGKDSRWGQEPAGSAQLLRIGFFTGAARGRDRFHRTHQTGAERAQVRNEETMVGRH